MSDSRFHLTVCDGTGTAHGCEIDDLEGSISIAHLAHERGFTCWLRDEPADVLVACSTAACFACSHEKDCGDSLPMSDTDSASAFFAQLLAAE